MQDLIEPYIRQCLDLDHNTLMWRVARNQPAEIGNVGQGDLHLGRKLHKGCTFAGRPGTQDPSLRIVERGGHGMASPKTWTVGGAVLV